MKKENMLKERLADNLKRYRKQNNLTQQQLAEKLNYSDKSISKWERKEGIPDVIILSRLADLYHINLDDFIKGEDEVVKSKHLVNRHRIISMLSFIGVWFLATIIYSILSIVQVNSFDLWLVFIYAIPASIIVLVVFSQIWGNKLQKFLSISLLLWSFVLAFVLSFSMENMWLLFIVAAPVQVMILLWARLAK